MSSRRIYIKRNDNVRGPISVERVLQLVAEGKVRDTDRVSSDPDRGWLTVAEFRASLNQSASSQRLVAQTQATSRQSLRHQVAVVIFAALVHAMLMMILAGVYMATRPEQEQLRLIASFSAATAPIDAPVVPEPVPVEISPQNIAPTEGSPAGATTSSPNPGDATDVVSAKTNLSPLAKLESAKSRVIDSVLRFGSEGMAGDGTGAGAGGGATADRLAIESALAWLCTIQKPDGRWTFWDVGDETTRGVYESDLSATGLAVLCLIRCDKPVGPEFAGAGDVEKGLWKEARDRGLQWLQDEMHSYLSAGGALSKRSEDDLLCYGHPIATMCLCEALTAEPDDQTLRDLAIRAVDDLQECQDFQSGGWGYQIHDPANLSVTGWSLLALHDARIAGIPLYERTLPALEIYTSNLLTSDGIEYRYRAGDISTPAMTAVGTLCRLLISSPDRHGELKPSIERISALGLNRKDAYFNFFAAQLMYQCGDEYWKPWSSEMGRVLFETQRKDGAAAGSWPVTDVTSFRGGQLYQTAMSLLALTTKTTPRLIPVPSGNAASADAVAASTMEESTSNQFTASETGADVSPLPVLPPVDETAAALAEKHPFVSPIQIQVNDREFTIGPRHPSPLVRDCFKNIELLSAAFGAKNLRLEDVDLTRVEKRGWIDGYNKETDVQYKEPVPTSNFVVCWDFNNEPKRFPTQRYFSYLDPTGKDIAFEELIALEVGYAICNALWTQYGVLDARVPADYDEWLQQKNIVEGHLARIGFYGWDAANQPHVFPFGSQNGFAVFSEHQKTFYDGLLTGDVEQHSRNLDAMLETIIESDWEWARSDEFRQRRFLYETFLKPERLDSTPFRNEIGNPQFTKNDLARVGMLAMTGRTPLELFVKFGGPGKPPVNAARERFVLHGFPVENNRLLTGVENLFMSPPPRIELKYSFQRLEWNARGIVVDAETKLSSNPALRGNVHRMDDKRRSFGTVVAAEVFSGGFIESAVFQRNTKTKDSLADDLHLTFYKLDDCFVPVATFTSAANNPWLGSPVLNLPRNLREGYLLSGTRTLRTPIIVEGESGWISATEILFEREVAPNDKAAPTWSDYSEGGGVPRNRRVSTNGTVSTVVLPYSEIKLYDDLVDRGSILVAFLTQTSFTAANSDLVKDIQSQGFRQNTRPLPLTSQDYWMLRLRASRGWSDGWFELNEFLGYDWCHFSDLRRWRRESAKPAEEFQEYKSLGDLMDNPFKIPPASEAARK